MKKRFILASASPRRRLLLAGLGAEFDVVTPTVKEDLTVNRPPGKMAEELAAAKAHQAAGRLQSGVVIAADTIVVCDNRILGKPESYEEACSMLRLLSGIRHTVITGLCVIDVATGRELVESETTAVYFRTLREEEIRRYADTGEPFDKAGGYGIQGQGALLVSGIEGCYYNVVGLPLARLQTMLEAVGVSLV